MALQNGSQEHCGSLQELGERISQDEELCAEV